VQHRCRHDRAQGGQDQQEGSPALREFFLFDHSRFGSRPGDAHSASPWRLRDADTIAFSPEKSRISLVARSRAVAPIFARYPWPVAQLLGLKWVVTVSVEKSSYPNAPCPSQSILVDSFPFCRAITFGGGALFAGLRTQC
jgi:hypothetical protein